MKTWLCLVYRKMAQATDLDKCHRRVTLSMQSVKKPKVFSLREPVANVICWLGYIVWCRDLRMRPNQKINAFNCSSDATAETQLTGFMPLPVKSNSGQCRVLICRDSSQETTYCAAQLCVLGS